MPSLQQTPNFKECNLASDILQKHSINSLLEHSDDLILSPHEMSPSEVDANLSFADIFNSLGTSTPKGYHSHSPDSNYIQTTPPKMFDNFQFDNRSLQRNLNNFDCNVTTTPTSPSTPSSFMTSPKAYMNSPSYGNDSGFYSNISRSDSPLINDSQDNLSSPTFETRSLADIMNYLNLSQAPIQQQQSQHQNQTNQNRYENQRKQDHHQQQNFLNAELKQLQAYQLLQQQKQLQQLNSQPINQLLQQQIINQMNLVNWRQQQQQQQAINSANTLDNLAKNHRSSAALFDPSCTWSGIIPPRAHRFITYSPKIFLGGLPWDLSETTLMQIFKPFGQIKVEWPGKEQNAAQPKGYVYIIFESEKQVKALLQACTIQDNFVTPPGINSSESNNAESSSANITTVPNGNYYYKISSRRIKEKEVEVIPWIIADSNYIKSANQKIESAKTVFVGALHGKLTAEGLAKIMNDLFDGVIYAGIDTDKYKYPIGSGRVTFNNTRSYMRAVAAAFIEIKSQKFSKKVQIDPYLEDSLCSVCGVQHGPYYCRDLSCFRYFCRQCWQIRHNNDSHLRNHKPLTRNSKSQQQIQAHYSMFNNSNGCSLSTSSGSSSGSSSSSPNEAVLSSMLNFQMMK
ncbi:cytoplasmic polyadenylation element-binding protein 3 isoform X1 [Chironomus tepperi]|uniref:cytoplasmic polyadenylation element-binding protein 3 isoform X1 n=1 Tax=Chironomus tepperi TaxID=113505 RepID=UPI00391EF175